MPNKIDRTVDRPDIDINLEDEAAVEEWCRAFACTTAELTRRGHPDGAIVEESARLSAEQEGHEDGAAGAADIKQ